MYQALKKAKIRCDYEGRTFTLVEGFNFDNETYERQTTVKVIWLIEVVKKYYLLNIHRTL